MNSVTTVLLSFPPIFALYLRFAESYGTPSCVRRPGGDGDSRLLRDGPLPERRHHPVAELEARAATEALQERVDGGGHRRSASCPLALLIPGAPPFLGEVVDVLPSGLAAQVSFGLVSGARWTRRTTGLASRLSVRGSSASSRLGVRMSRGQFYEVLQLEDQAASGLGRGRGARARRGSRREDCRSGRS